MKLILRREQRQPDANCTLGLLFIGELTLCTLELSWIPSPICRGGTDLRSCVPVGTYRLEHHNSEKHPMTWALVNPDLDVVHYDPTASAALRDEVLIHVANFPSELLGCIALGTRAGPAVGRAGYQLFDSRKAMQLLQAGVPWPGDSHILEISEAT